MRLISWNVNGLRAILKKDFVENVKAIDPDVLCLQETKAQSEDVRTALELLPGYEVYVNSSKARKGYSGTAILSKKAPLEVQNDIGIEEHDQEGRVITAEYDDFYLVTAYVPNSGRGLVRLDYRTQWDRDFLKYLQQLESEKPVLLCGDLNVAHQPIDLKNDKSNYNKTAGYTQVEIDGFSRMLDAGWVDSFRHYYPEEIAYTYWSYMFDARARNTGWRIDYFIASKNMLNRINKAFILPDYLGSDHCPVGVEL
ncbi:MAG: exodeoxyribonuclease III [Cyclobacteriaceae bacterium]